MNKELLRKSVLAIVADKIPMTATWHKVKSVQADADPKSCTVLLDEDDALELPEVMLGYNNSGSVILPTPGKMVLVLWIGNTKTVGAVVMVEQTDALELMGKKHGGVPISEELAKEINIIKKDINDLKEIFGTVLWTVVPNDGGLALKTATATWAGQKLEDTDKEQISNKVVTHGNGE